MRSLNEKKNDTHVIGHVYSNSFIHNENVCNIFLYQTICNMNAKIYDEKKIKIDCVFPKLYYQNIKISFVIGTQTLVLI